MKLEFTKEASVNEYVNGPLHIKNDGKPVEVAANVAETLLNAKHTVDGSPVSIFRPADKQAKAVGVNLIEAYPENFPNADVLSKAGFAHTDVLLLNREQLVNIQGIGEKSADTILEFVKEK